MTFEVCRYTPSFAEIHAIAKCLHSKRPKLTGQSCLQQQTSRPVHDKFNLALGNSIGAWHAWCGCVENPSQFCSCRHKFRSTIRIKLLDLLLTSNEVLETSKSILITSRLDRVTTDPTCSTIKEDYSIILIPDPSVLQTTQNNGICGHMFTKILTFIVLNTTLPPTFHILELSSRTDKTMWILRQVC